MKRIVTRKTFCQKKSSFSPYINEEKRSTQSLPTRSQRCQLSNTLSRSTSLRAGSADSRTSTSMRERGVAAPRTPTLCVGRQRTSAALRRPTQSVGKLSPNFRTKNKRNIAIIHIKCTKNNTIYTLTDLRGNTCGWISGGSVGFNHSRKTSYPATQKSGKEIINLTRKHQFDKIILKIKGYTRRKKVFIRPLLSKRMRRGQSFPRPRQKLQIEKIVNGQSIPFNGCRPPVKRRK